MYYCIMVLKEVFLAVCVCVCVCVGVCVCVCVCELVPIRGIAKLFCIASCG